MSLHLKQAKRFFIVNIVSNVLAVLSNSLVGIWMTPFLIRNMGVAVYGMVPLVSSISSYLSIFNLTVSGAVGRFVALHLDRHEEERANIYFNTSIFGLMGIGLLVTVPLLASLGLIPHLVNIPQGYERDFSILLMLVILSSFAGAVTSSFQVSTFVTSKFYVYNIVKIASRLLQILLLVLLFKFLNVSLAMVGAAIFGMTLFLLFALIVVSRKLVPQLVVRPRYFRRKALTEMGGMGSWMVVDQVGSLLYLNADLILINIFLGPGEVGRYAPLLQLVLLLRILAPAIAGVFAPIAIEYIAHNQLQKLGNHTEKAIKFMGLFLALPAGLLCGMAEPFLGFWLGPTFTDLSPLVWILLLPQVLFLAVNPLYNINRGMNKVKIPALVTIAGGLLNVGLAIVFISVFNLGLLGMALASTISFALRTVVFLPVYTAKCLELPGNSFFRTMPTSFAAVALIFLGCRASYEVFASVGVAEMIMISILLSIAYGLAAYFLVLKADEREIVQSIFGLKKKAIA